MEEERIEEISVRLVVRTGGGYGSTSAQWVDGSEVVSESPPWSLLDENESRESRDGYGSVKRRLVKKLKRVNSFDVEAMEITGFQDHHAKDPSLWQTVALAFQTLSVVYGDMGTSPLYVFTDVFNKCSQLTIMGKSQSLLVTARSTVKIGDFSVSQVFEDDNDELRHSPGTPVFTAPECCLGLTYGGKAADTWAVGVTLYCMLFATYPFLGDTLQDTYDKIVNNPLSLPDHMNPLLKKLIEGLLCKVPSRKNAWYH